MSDGSRIPEGGSEAFPLDRADLATVRKAIAEARAIGHWRRILAIYGDHLDECATRRLFAGTPSCDCGWAEAFQ